MLQITSVSPERTSHIGKVLGSLLCTGDVLSLNGDLGSGKTCLASGVAKGLGIDQRVSSPTFALVNEYDSGRLPFYHMDVYRLSGPEDLDDFGYEEYIDSDGVTLIEWADKIKSRLPGERLDIKITGHLAEGTPENLRTLFFIPHGNRFNALIEELKSHVCAGY